MKIYSKIDIGRVRAANQDAFFTAQLSDTACFAVVCDGMGGANAGNVASEKAVSRISEYIKKSYRPDMKSRELWNMLSHAVESANIEVYDMSLNDSSLTGMGTTAVLALVQGNTAVIAHVGDSRIYLVNDRIKQLTRDHSVVQALVESGKLTSEAAKSHPRKNVITRAVGTEERIAVDCDELTLAPGDTLLLCTDGLTNFLEAEDILKIFRENEAADRVEKLVAAANENGGGDNITVVTITA